MNHRTILKMFRRALPAVLVAAAAVPAFAGPPLICSRLDIGTASSLPWNVGPNWRGDVDTYDRSRLTSDTLALLTETTPVLVRMETLRRAAIYAMTDRPVAGALLTALVARAKKAGAGGQIDALSLFDAGYLAESYKQADAISPGIASLVSAIDGRAMVERSLALRGGDPAVAFAASLMTGGPAHANHLKTAQEGAKGDLLLAKNLAQANH